MTAAPIKKDLRKPDPNLLASQFFVQCLGAYLECSPEVQEVIQDMAKIVNDPEATSDERDAALATVADALFPSGHDGVPGLDLQEAERREGESGKNALAAMDREEETFAERLQALLEQKGMTQNDLADAVGVGQPAISMMLSRQCRPQRRTVEKIAQALQVAPEQLWPGRKDQ